MPSGAGTARPPLPQLVERADIQGLRGLAVLLVVLDHAGVPGLAGGYVGVDVFFVLSGYLISSILLREATVTGRVSLVGFYAKRARRILPAATVVLVTTAVAATLIVSFVRAELIRKDVLWSAFFAANIHFGDQGTDYFSADLPPSPVQHFWSLAVEEQFYLVWPVLLILVLTLGAGGLQSVRRRVPVLTAIVAALCLASLAWSIHLTSDAPVSAYFSTFARGWELGVGALLALFGHALTRVHRRVGAALGWIGLGAIVAAAVGYDARTAFPGWTALLPVLGTALVLVAGASGAPAGAARVLGVRPLRGLGDVSYSLYLWHWPMLVLAAAYAGHRLSLVESLVVVAVALAAAVATYHAVENPVRHARLLRLRPRRTLLLWPAAAGVVLACSVWTTAQIQQEQEAAAAGYRDVDLSLVPASERVPRTTSVAHNSVAEALDRATLDSPLPFPLAQDLTAIADDRWDGDRRCAAQPDDSSSAICPVGDPSATRSIVLLGDSHANMWLPALDRIGQRAGFQVVPIIKFGCSPVDIAIHDRDMGGFYRQCDEWRDWALDQVRALDPTVVVVGSATQTVYSFLAEDHETVLDEAAAMDAWQDGVGRLVGELATVTDEVRFLGDTVVLPDSPAECLSKHDATMASCTVPLSQSTQDINDRTELGLRGTAARFIRTTRLVCADLRCPMAVDGTVVFQDRQHITETYALTVTDALQRRLDLPS